MKNKIIICIVMILIALPVVAAEMAVEIQMVDSFGAGERLKFDYTLQSDSSLEVTILPHIKCPNAPVALLKKETINLEGNVPYAGIYEDLVVDESFEPQTCEAYIEFVEPERERVSEAFSIETEPIFSFGVDFCKDSGCLRKTRVFVKDEEVFISYGSEVKGSSFSATLSLPDGSRSDVNLPISVRVNQVGVYTLDVSAFKKGYQGVNEKMKFAVIAEKPTIGEINFQAVREPVRLSPDDKRDYVLPLIFLVVILVVGILLIRKKKK